MINLLKNIDDLGSILEVACSQVAWNFLWLAAPARRGVREIHPFLLEKRGRTGFGVVFQAGRATAMFGRAGLPAISSARLCAV
jgi:hypothetical protein